MCLYTRVLIGEVEIESAVLLELADAGTEPRLLVPL